MTMCTNDNLIDRCSKRYDYAADDQIDFLSNPSKILHALIESKQNGTSIGLKAPHLFKDVLVTGIEDIILDFDSGPIIVLKKYDSNGYMLERERLSLSEIESVFPFKSSFENPFLKELGRVSRFYLRTP